MCRTEAPPSKCSGSLHKSRDESSAHPDSMMQSSAQLKNQWLAEVSKKCVTFLMSVLSHFFKFSSCSCNDRSQRETSFLAW
jgi:hypothetical protein